MSVRDYLKNLHLFEMTKFLTSEENPTRKAWFYYDETGKVIRHSFEPADKEWDGSGIKPLIVPLGKDGDQTRLNENWAAFVDMAEEYERRERGG